MWTIAALMHVGAFLLILTVVATIATVASIAYCLLGSWAAWRFRRQRANCFRQGTGFSPVSILKPIKGTDPEMYEALRSHCVQEYPEYEVLFGISDDHDPAAPVIGKLQHEFPERKLRLVRCPKALGANGKVSTLAQLASVASHEVLVVNDSDIRVAPDYLRTITSELGQPGVGMVTCLYRGVPAATIGSRLEALGISTDFAPGVLAAQLIERGLHFGLGSTLAFRRRDLEAIGGFESLADYLADDYELGRRIAELGLKIELSQTIVETHLPPYDLAGFFSHQLRWARTIRASRPGGYAGLLLTFTLPWAVAVLLFAGGAAWVWWVLTIGLLARTLMATISAGLVLSDKPALRLLWLLPIRDLLGPVVWAGGWTGSGIVWRGERFQVERGKLKPE